MDDQTLKAKDKFGTDLPEQHLPLVLVAYQLRTPENMGMILRLAGNVGAEKVVFVRSSDQEIKERKLKKTAQTAAQHINWIFCLPEEIEKNLPEGYAKIAVETTEKAKNLFDFQFPKGVILFFGNEVKGLPNSIIDQCQESVFIPMPGPTRSMNVAMAASVAVFSVLRQFTR